MLLLIPGGRIGKGILIKSKRIAPGSKFSSRCARQEAPSYYSFSARPRAGREFKSILEARAGKGSGILLLLKTIVDGNGKFLGTLQYVAWPLTILLFPALMAAL